MPTGGAAMVCGITEVSLQLEACPCSSTRSHIPLCGGAQVTVTPRFVVVNCLDVDITIRQCGACITTYQASRAPFTPTCTTACHGSYPNNTTRLFNTSGVLRFF